jgi:hypothetical protein
VTASLPQPQNIALEQLGRLIGLLDTGEVFGEIEAQRWAMAADDGEWTAGELEAAVRWLNLNHTGYVKIAHVHKRIVSERQWFKIGRMFCYLHPNAVDVVNAKIGDDRRDAETVRRMYEDSPRGWRDAFEADVLATLPAAEWASWARKSADSFPGRSA